MMYKISFKLLDKYNLCGIIKNVENRWIDDSSQRIMLEKMITITRLLRIDGLSVFMVVFKCVIRTNYA